MLTHGINMKEVPTSIKPAVVAGNLPVIFGTAPVNRATDPKVNKVQILFSMDQVHKYFGYAKDYENYTLTEAADIFFQLYNVAPVVFVNVLDPARHKKSVAEHDVTLVGDSYEIKSIGILAETLIIKNQAGTLTYNLGTDYILEWTSKGLEIVIIEGGTILENDTLKIAYEELDPSLVTNEDIIGTKMNGVSSGLALVEEVYPVTRKVPTMLLVPKYGESSAIAAILDSKADNINSCFTCMSIVDVDESITDYTLVPAYKNNNNILSPNQILCWPKVKLGDDVYRLGTQLAAHMMVVDMNNSDVPLESPSNKNMRIDGTVVKKDGNYEDINLSLPEANYLNDNGIITTINFIVGWTAWGNRTACYPANTDIKDSFINVKRMFQYYATSFILTHWIDVDKTIRPRLVESIVDSRNEFYLGEISKENIIDGRIEFIQAENSTGDLLSGKLTFHNHLCIGGPAEQITGLLEFDPSGFSKLFG